MSSRCAPGKRGRQDPHKTLANLKTPGTWTGTGQRLNWKDAPREVPSILLSLEPPTGVKREAKETGAEQEERSRFGDICRPRSLHLSLEWRPSRLTRWCDRRPVPRSGCLLHSTGHWSVLSMNWSRRSP